MLMMEIRTCVQLKDLTLHRKARNQESRKSLSWTCCKHEQI